MVRRITTRLRECVDGQWAAKPRSVANGAARPVHANCHESGAGSPGRACAAATLLRHVLDAQAHRRGRTTGEPGPGVARTATPGADPARLLAAQRRVSPCAALRLHRLACSSRHHRIESSAGAPRRPPGRGGPSTVITELEFKSLAAQGYNRIPLHRRGLRRPRDAAVAVPEAGLRQRRRQAQLPARIGGRRRALRALFVHRPAGAHAAARQRLPHRGRHRRRGRRDARGQPARLHRRLPAALQGRAAPGPAALLRRPGRLLRLRRGALHRAQARADAGSPAASTRPTSCCCSARSWRSSTTCRAGCT